MRKRIVGTVVAVAIVGVASCAENPQAPEVVGDPAFALSQEATSVANRIYGPWADEEVQMRVEWALNGKRYDKVAS